MSDTKTATPRTDKSTGWGIGGLEVVPASFARELERELAEQVIANGKGGEREADLLGKVARLERENASLRAAMRAALKRLASE